MSLLIHTESRPRSYLRFAGKRTHAKPTQSELDGPNYPFNIYEKKFSDVGEYFLTLLGVNRDAHGIKW